MITQPFDFNPVSIGFGDNSTPYTVPAEKYSLITATLSVSAKAQITVLSAGDTIFGSAPTNSESTSIQFWLKAGDIVSATASAASGSATSELAGSLATVSSSSKATLSVNAGAGAKLISEIEVDIAGSILNNSISTRTVVLSGKAKVKWIATEYSVLT